MKKVLAIVLAITLVLFVSGIVYAEDEVIAPGNGSTQQGLYGQCVSENAALKNTCFATVKDTLKSCKAPAKEGKDKATSKLCKQNHKQAKKQCKIAFKAAKEQCRLLKNSTSEDSETTE